jgi:ATP-dependent RNA helicase DDX42
VLPSDVEKWNWLTEHLPGISKQGGTMIFVNRIGLVNDLAHNLQVTDYSCVGLHGSMTQEERDMAILQFHQGHAAILVATDLAGRGLDIESVKTVINYDAARDLETHIHRIGRTGRAGDKGVAYTLITQKEDRFAGELVRHLEASQRPVPKELLNLAMQVSFLMCYCSNCEARKAF